MINYYFGDNIENSLSQKLWGRDIDKDFTFIIGGSEEIKAHKNVLAANSPIFNILVKTESSIEINEFDFLTVEKAIRFCYDYCCEESVEDSITSLKFANQYEFQELREAIEYDLIEKIDADNICKLANLSMEYKLNELRKECFKCLTYSFKSGKKFIPNIETLDNEFTKPFLIEAFKVVVKEDESTKAKKEKGSDLVKDIKIIFFFTLFITLFVALIFGLVLLLRYFASK